LECKRDLPVIVTPTHPNMKSLQTRIPSIQLFIISFVIYINNNIQLCSSFIPITTPANRRHYISCDDEYLRIRNNNQFSSSTSSSVTSLQALDFLSGFNFEDLIFSAQSSASNLAASTMSSTSITPLSLIIMYFAGTLTSISPCSLGLLPLTMSYISTAAGEREDKAAFFPTLAFASGLASVFVGLGLSVSLLGGVFGQSNSDNLIASILLVALSSGVSITMGFQMLGLVDLPLPSLELPMASSDTSSSGDDNMSSELVFDDDGVMIDMSSVSYNSDKQESGAAASALFRTFLLGGSSALVASPCATPVLTSILAYVAASQNPALGAALLFTYTAGYSTPLLIIGATGGEALAKAQAVGNDGSIVGKVGRVVNPFTAGILIWYGTTGLLEGLFGDPSLSGLAVM